MRHARQRRRGPPGRSAAHHVRHQTGYEGIARASARRHGGSRGAPGNGNGDGDGDLDMLIDQEEDGDAEGDATPDAEGDGDGAIIQLQAEAAARAAEEALRTVGREYGAG